MDVILQATKLEKIQSKALAAINQKLQNDMTVIKRSMKLLQCRWNETPFLGDGIMVGVSSSNVNPVDHFCDALSIFNYSS